MKLVPASPVSGSGHVGLDSFEFRNFMLSHIAGIGAQHTNTHICVYAME